MVTCRGLISKQGCKGPYKVFACSRWRGYYSNNCRGMIRSLWFMHLCIAQAPACREFSRFEKGSIGLRVSTCKCQNCVIKEKARHDKSYRTWCAALTDEHVVDTTWQAKLKNSSQLLYKLLLEVRYESAWHASMAALFKRGGAFGARSVGGREKCFHSIRRNRGEGCGGRCAGHTQHEDDQVITLGQHGGHRFFAGAL